MTTFIVIGSAVVLFFLCVVLPACYLTSATHEQRAEAEFWGDHRPPVTDDPAEWTGPLRKASRANRQAARDMWAFHASNGLVLLRKASARTRKTMAALDARRPRRSWVPRWLSRAVSPATVEMPPAEEIPVVHHEDERLPVLAAAPLAELGDQLPAAPVTEPSLIGDALEAEMGRVPEHVREGDGEQDGDLPEWMEEWLAKPLPGDEPTAALSDTQWRGFPAIKDGDAA